MGSMFSKPKMSEVIATPTISTTSEDLAAKEAAAKEAARIKKKKGYASTIKTTEEGLTEAPTVLKEKLGA